MVHCRPVVAGVQGSEEGIVSTYAAQHKTMIPFFAALKQTRGQETGNVPRYSLEPLQNAGFLLAFDHVPHQLEHQQVPLC
jgi:hypothetical protein